MVGARPARWSTPGLGNVKFTSYHTLFIITAYETIEKVFSGYSKYITFAFYHQKIKDAVFLDITQILFE